MVSSSKAVKVGDRKKIIEGKVKKNVKKIKKNKIEETILSSLKKKIIEKKVKKSIEKIKKNQIEETGLPSLNFVKVGNSKKIIGDKVKKNVEKIKRDKIGETGMPSLKFEKVGDRKKFIGDKVKKNIEKIKKNKMDETGLPSLNLVKVGDSKEIIGQKVKKNAEKVKRDKIEETRLPSLKFEKVGDHKKIMGKKVKKNIKMKNKIEETSLTSPKVVKVSVGKIVNGEKVKKSIHKKEKIEEPGHSLLRVSVPKKIQPEAAIKDGKSKVKKKYVMPSKAVSEELVVSCLNALDKLTEQYKKKNVIFEDEIPVFAVINCIKIQNKSGNIKLTLPHSTVMSTGEICLITPDLKKGRKPDHEPTVDFWEERLRQAEVTKVKTVLPMRQLRVEYDQYEMKRRLLTQHDFIMVDTRVLNHVSHVLGQRFFKKHNMLIPVRINEKGNLKKDIELGLRSVMLRLSQGQTSTVVVGHTGMSRTELKENILSLIQQLRKRYPGGEANVRSVDIKLPLSLALPLYLTLRPSNTVHPPKLQSNKSKHYIDVEDELSTIPGSTVRVAPDGTVHLKKRQKVGESDPEDEDVENTDQDGPEEQAE